MTLANVSDVATELGQPTPTETTVIRQWTAWLTRVESMIRNKITDLDTRLASGILDRTLVVGIEAAAVARVARNPEGLRQTSTTVDDGTVAKTRDAVVSDGQLRITDDEWDQLLPALASEAMSVRASYTPGWHHHHDCWDYPW